MLKGFSHIFKFTFKQGIKQKAFILSTVIVALLIFGGVFGINVYLGSDSKNEDSESTIENIYFENCKFTNCENNLSLWNTKPTLC